MPFRTLHRPGLVEGLYRNNFIFLHEPLARTSHQLSAQGIRYGIPRRTRDVVTLHQPPQSAGWRTEDMPAGSFP